MPAPSPTTVCVESDVPTGAEARGIPIMGPIVHAQDALASSSPAELLAEIAIRRPPKRHSDENSSDNRSGGATTTTQTTIIPTYTYVENKKNQQQPSCVIKIPTTTCITNTILPLHILSMLLLCTATTTATRALGATTNGWHYCSHYYNY